MGLPRRQWRRPDQHRTRSASESRSGSRSTTPPAGSTGATHAIRSPTRTDGSGGVGAQHRPGRRSNEPGPARDRPRAGRIYWANFKLGLPKVSYANLDGSGGRRHLEIEPVPNNGTGVALDPASGRVFWSALDGTIHSSTLDGIGAVDLNLIGATNPESIRSIAIDLPPTGSSGPRNGPPAAISFANLNGSGGDDLATADANLAFPAAASRSCAAPAGTAPPTITGQLTARSTLTCSQGGWAPDAPASLFYRAPQSFAYQWLRGGAPIAGATQPTLSPASSGAYSCQVTATNYAGSTSQTSAAVSVGSRNAVAGRIAIVKKGKARLRLRCPGPERCRGTVSLIAFLRHRGDGEGEGDEIQRLGEILDRGREEAGRSGQAAGRSDGHLPSAKRRHRTQGPLIGSGVERERSC